MRAQKAKIPARLVPAFAAILRGTHRYIMLHGGRCSGKTITVCLAILYHCMMGKSRWLCLRATQNSIADSSKETLEQLIRLLRSPTGAPLAHLWRVTNRDITYLPTGSIILFKGMKGIEAALRGQVNLSGAWIDEAQAVDAKAWGDLLSTIRPFVDPTKKPVIIACWNPQDPEQPIHRDFVVNPRYPDQSLVIEQNFWHNPFMPEEMFAKQAADKLADPEWWAHEWGGKALILSAAQVFRLNKDWHIGEIEIPERHALSYGFDVGMGRHPSIGLRVFYWHEEGDPKGTIYIADEQVDMDFDMERFLDFFQRLGVREGDTVYSDWQGLPWQRTPDNWSFVHVKKSPMDEDKGVQWMRGQHIYIHPQCQTAIRHFTRYSAKLDKNDAVIHGQYADHDDDAPDAVRYALRDYIVGNRTLKDDEVKSGGYSVVPD